MVKNDKVFWQLEPRYAKQKKKPLSAQVIRFAERCFEHGNATRAFRKVGFADSVKESSVRELASRLVRKRQVSEYIREQEKVAKEAARVAILARWSAKM